MAYFPDLKHWLATAIVSLTFGYIETVEPSVLVPITKKIEDVIVDEVNGGALPATSPFAPAPPTPLVGATPPSVESFSDKPAGELLKPSAPSKA